MSQLYCGNCGAPLQENAAFCGSCGVAVAYDTIEPANEVPVQQEKTKKANWKVILITILSISVATLIGEFAGKFITNIFTSNRDAKKIEAYIERISDYTPGYCTEDKYVSEHFELKFVTNDNWIMYSKEDLQPLAQKVKQSSISTGMESMKAQGISQELMDKWLNSVYIEAEMGAYCVIDDMVVGEAVIVVMGAAGIDETSEREFVEDLGEHFSTVTSDIYYKQKNIAGELFEGIQVSLTIDGLDMVNEEYAKLDDGMFCVITCKAIKGYEDFVVNSFFNQVSAYDD